MKLLMLAVLVAAVAAQDEAPFGGAAMNQAIRQGMETYDTFLNATTKDPSCVRRGCCPVIVPNGPKGSVIQPFTGYRGNAAIIVDWGREGFPCSKGRNCTTSDVGFIYYVDWGDGSYDSKYLKDFGPFQVAHQYREYDQSYGVTAYYCSAPYYYQCPHKRCCDSLYRVIDVSFDPGHPHYPDVFPGL